MDIGIIWKGMGICFVCRFILLASQNSRSFQAPSYQCQKICSYRIEWCIMFLPGVESSPFVSWESLDKVSREVVIEFALSGRLLRSRVRRLSLLLHLKKHKSENQSKEKDTFLILSRVWANKNSDAPWAFEPQTFGFCTLIPYHWAVETLQWPGLLLWLYMTCLLQTAGISNVLSIMCTNRIRKMVNFELGNEMETHIFLFCHRHGTENQKTK